MDAQTNRSAGPPSANPLTRCPYPSATRTGSDHPACVPPTASRTPPPDLSSITACASSVRTSATASDLRTAKAKDQQILTLAGRWETSSAVLGSLIERVQFDLADDP